MLLVFESIVASSIASNAFSQIIGSFCNNFSPFISGQTYQSARERIVPLYMNMVFLQSVYRSIRWKSKKNFPLYLTVDLQRLVCESLELTLPHVIHLLSSNYIPSGKNVSCRLEELRSMISDLFSPYHSAGNPIPFALQNEDSNFCLTWFYLVCSPISYSGLAFLIPTKLIGKTFFKQQ